VTARRNGVLIVDSGVIALSNAMVLIAGARSLDADDLVQLTLFQIFASIAVGLFRATFLSPALAVRGQRGASLRLSASWMTRLALPAGLLGGGLCVAGVRPGGESVVLLVVLAMVSVPLMLVQDTTRFILLSNDDARSTLASDLVWVLVSAPLLVVASAHDSWTGFAWAWSAGAAAGVLLGVTRVHQLRPRTERVGIRETLLLGRWSGLDAGLSATAMIVPILVSTYALTSADAAVYRILQTGLGPLNVLSAALLTIFGLDAARYTDLEIVRAVPHKTLAQSAALAGVAAVVLLVGIPGLLILSGTPVTGNWVPVIITIYAGAAGAATIPYASVAAAMGGQRYGLYLRIGVLALSLGIGAAAAARVFDLSIDPIGAVTLVSSTINLWGWSVATRRLCRQRLASASYALPEDDEVAVASIGLVQKLKSGGAG
jgi:hypothetical protein